MHWRSSPANRATIRANACRNRDRVPFPKPTACRRIFIRIASGFRSRSETEKKKSTAEPSAWERGGCSLASMLVLPVGAGAPMSHFGSIISTPISESLMSPPSKRALGDHLSKLAPRIRPLDEHEAKSLPNDERVEHPQFQTFWTSCRIASGVTSRRRSMISARPPGLRTRCISLSELLDRRNS